MYCIPLVENIIFLENQHAQGQTYIPIIRFPDPNYGIQAIKYNKLPSPIVRSPSASLYIAQMPLLFTFVDPNVEFYIPNRREFSMDFKNKVNNNIWGSITPVKAKKAKGVIWVLQQRHHFKIPM